MMRHSRSSDPPTLVALVDDAMQRKGRDLLVADERERYSGQAARTIVDRLAYGFTELGVHPGERVAFLVGASARHALTFFACQQQGIVPCALHLRETVARLAEALGWLEASVVVCDSEHEELAASAIDAAAFSPSLITIGADPPVAAGIDLRDLFLVDPAPHELVRRSVRADDLALIMLSSGTTGAPKGTLNLQRTLAATAEAGSPIFGPITSDSAVVVPVAPSAAAWIHIVLPFLTGGAAIHFMRQFNPVAYVETLAREMITHAPGVPTMWRMVLEALRHEPRALPHLRVAFFAGEVGSTELVTSLARELPGVHVRTAYLSAEGGCASAVAAGEATLIDGHKPSAAGRAIDGCGLRIVAPDGSVDVSLPTGEDGEIVLRSRSVAPGYWKADELTHRRFVDGWWRSGDIGHLDEANELFIVGRTDHVINTGGIKVHAEEVEAALMQHPAVIVAAVVPEHHERWGQAVVAHVVLSDPDTTADEIVAFCRERELVAPVKLPKRIVFHEKLPVGPTGKLNRRALVPDARARDTA